MSSVQTVCLNMIVRNECRIIQRCLNSVKSFIDHWVIVDTGSTDGTQQLIRECLRDVPGELIERPWVDFGHNRTEALEFARGKSDYVLVIDADEVLLKDDDYVRPQLTHDAYYFRVRFLQIVFWRVHLFRTEMGLRYESPIHEYLVLGENATSSRLNGVAIDSLRDGWRAAQPDFWQRDLELLLKAHEQTPNDGRTNFYLGQTYHSAGKPELALKYYEQSVQTSSWPEEQWVALFLIGELKQQLQRDWSEVLAAYLEAYQFRPERAEPLYRIAVNYRWQGSFHLAHLFLKQAVAIPFPDGEYLFVEERLYRYLIKMALATCCYHIGDYEAGLRYCEELLESPESMPANIYQQVLVNRQQCVAKIVGSYSPASEHWPKMKVLVAFHSFGPHLDNGIDRLLDQTCVPLEMIFLDLDSRRGSDHQQIPTEDPRVTLLRRSEGESTWSCVASHCEDNDIVLLLNGGDWLISEEALAHLQKFFTDPACLVTYGQFQHADGAPGLARWISDFQSDRLLTDDWRCTYPLAVRGRLLQQVVGEEPVIAAPKTLRGDPHSDGFTAEEHVALARTLFTAAGPAGVRFNAEPICVHDSEATDKNCFVQVQANGASILHNTLPKISCLTVTSNRLVLLKEAIHCYCQQTYPNKELIIVTDGTPRYRQAIRDYITWLGRDDIQPVCADKSGQTLSALRNVSLDAASGTIVCQWDSGDLNHPQRLERQFERLSAANTQGCCLTDRLQFFFRERLLYWSDWRTNGGQGLIPRTLMAHRNSRFRYPEINVFAGKSEDSMLLEEMANNVAPFQDAGFLNIHSYHGQNVFSEAEHQLVAVYGSRSVDYLREHESILRDALRHYRLPEPYSIATTDGPLISIQNEACV